MARLMVKAEGIEDAVSESVKELVILGLMGIVNFICVWFSVSLLVLHV